MTAAGLALIAGGLATLISFRSVLFGGARGARRRRPGAIEAPRRRPALPAAPALPPMAEVAEVAVPAAEAEPGRRSRRGRRRAMAVSSDLPRPDEDDRGGLASIGFADEIEFAEATAGEADDVPDTCADAEEADELATAPSRPDRYGDRVEGWVRPEYHEAPAEEPRPGEYWTPIPVDLAGDHEPSAKGYGWPRPVERLPAVPDYEPATGFDLIPVAHEPTEVVPAWPRNDDRPGRIRLPRSWATRNEKPERPEKPATPERPRPRPRPRPGPPADRNNTIYVSRHAADQPPPPPPPPPRQGH
jgi:hypothetical protein